MSLNGQLTVTTVKLGLDYKTIGRNAAPTIVKEARRMRRAEEWISLPDHC
jgi:hypothetical protein